MLSSGCCSRKPVNVAGETPVGFFSIWGAPEQPSEMSVEPARQLFFSPYVISGHLKIFIWPKHCRLREMLCSWWGWKWACLWALGWELAENSTVVRLEGTGGTQGCLCQGSCLWCR